MKINKLDLINFRCFHEYELSLSDRFTLLIGDNGSCKTAVLDGLAIATGVFLMGVPELNLIEAKVISPNDISYSSIIMGQTPIKESVKRLTFVTANGSINGREARWTVHNHSKLLNNFPQISYDNEILELVANLTDEKTNINTIFPIISYYSTQRLWRSETNKEIEILSPESRLIGYKNCLNPSSDLERTFRWFKTQELAALQKKETRHN